MSVMDLAHCAAKHLAHYVDPTSGRAFSAYDRVGDPEVLNPVDLLAPALLNAHLSNSRVIDMYRPEGPYRELRERMEALLADSSAADARFVDQDLAAQSGPWALVIEVLKASDKTPDIKAAKVTKILHRKRPQLVPIFDSRVAGFYGVTRLEPWHLWPHLQAELRAHGPWLQQLAADYRTPDGRELSWLRILDIVVWEHSWGCSS